MRGIEIEVPNQPNALPPFIEKKRVKRNKPLLESIIDSIPSPSFKYSPIAVPLRLSESYETLKIKKQILFDLFLFFFDLNIFKIIAENINLKVNKEYSRNSQHQRYWHDIFVFEIDAFLRILLYMSYARMPRIADYWNTNLSLAVHKMMIQNMSLNKWKCKDGTSRG